MLGATESPLVAPFFMHKRLLIVLVTRCAVKKERGVVATRSSVT